MIPLALALALGPAAHAAERRYALVIGENHGLASEVPLRYAESDARRVASTLTSLAGVAPGDLVLITGADAVELRRAFGDLSARIYRDHAERSVLFVYYSGHGDEDALHLANTTLPLRELRALVAAAPVDLRLLVADACQSGELVRLKGGKLIEPARLVIEPGGAAEGLAILTASAEGEDAMESDHLQGGVFTHHLLAGLAGAADRSGDLQVTLNEAYDYVFARTLSTTSRAPVVQHPSFALALSGVADIPLTRLTDARRTGQLRLAEGGIYVIFDADETRLVAEVEVPAGAVLALPQGRYRVRNRLPDRVYEGQVEVRVGEQVALDRDDLSLQPYAVVTRRGETSEPHVAMAIVAGGGARGALTMNADGGPTGSLGLRADLPWITLMASASAGSATTSNSHLTISQRQAGLELSALRQADVWRASFGLGLSGGGEAVWQRFDAPSPIGDRLAFGGHIGPAARAEITVLPRVAVGLSGSYDITALPGETEDGDQLMVRAVPRGGLDVSIWFR